MRKFYSVFRLCSRITLIMLFSLLILNGFSACRADDDNDAWGAMIKDFDKETDSGGKVITNSEFNKAVQTKENIINKGKKKGKKSGKSTELKPAENPIFEMPDSPNPLLVLPVDAYFENITIKQGFYLVNLKQKDGKYFLELIQGNKTPVAVIEATGNSLPGKTIFTPEVSVENIDSKTIKINYKGNNLILEAILYK